MVGRLQQGLDQEYEASAGYKPNKADWLEGQWAGLQVASSDDRRGSTAVEFDLLKEVGYSISEVPAHVHVNPKIIRQLKAKRQMIDTGEGIAWARAASPALGQRLLQAARIRLAAQEHARGTFRQPP